MKFLLCFVFIFFSLPSSAEILRARFFNFSAKPTEANLIKFTSACGKGAETLPFESRKEIAEQMQKLGLSRSSWAIRGLVEARRCSSGASALALNQFLGTEVLLRSPSALIGALALSRVSRSEVERLGRMESEELFGIECSDERCRVKRRKFFAMKKDAVQFVKPGPVEGNYKKWLLVGIATSLNPAGDLSVKLPKAAESSHPADPGSPSPEVPLEP